MSVRFLSFSGVDQTLNFHRLEHLWHGKAFRGVFGVLLKQDPYLRSIESPRYPHLNWLNDWVDFACTHEVPYAPHLCGNYTQDFLYGRAFNPDGCFLTDFCMATPCFAMQLNLLGAPLVDYWKPIAENLLRFVGQIPGIRQFDYIIQVWDETTHRFALSLQENRVPVRILFDKSRGKGVPIDINGFPAPPKGIACGYAGGLGPSNIQYMCKGIEDLNARYDTHRRFHPWLDMESSLRGTNDEFSLDRVMEAYYGAKPFLD